MFKVSKGVKIVFILVLIVSTFVLGQDKQDKQDKQLREEILEVYNSDGEQGLRHFVKKQKDKIFTKFIVDFANTGVEKRNEDWLKACKVLAEEIPDEKALADVLFQTGRYFDLISDYRRAIDCYNKTLPIYKELNDSLGLCNVYMRKGHISLYYGDSDEALRMHDKALLYYNKAGQPGGLGNLYGSKGDVYSAAGESSKALEMYDKALQLFKKSGQPAGQGTVYLKKGMIYSYKGNYSRAFEMYDKALPLLIKARYPFGLGHLYLRKGEIYIEMGDNARALMMFDKAISLFKKTGGSTAQAIIYSEKGEIYLKTGDYSKALEMVNKALALTEIAGQIVDRGNMYMLKGEVYFETGDNSRALEMVDKAQPIFEKAGQPFGQGSVHLCKGYIYSRIGDNFKALEMFDKALYLFETAGAIESAAIVLHGKAKVLEKLKKKDEAMDLFEKSIVKLEKVRTQTGFSEMKKTYMETAYDHYQETVRFMLENKYHDKGFKYAEAMRTRVFLDQMAEGLVGLDKGLTPDLEKKRDNLTAKLSLLSKKIHKTAGEKDKKKLQELKEQYRKAENEFEDLLVKIRLNNPLYASVKYPDPITVRTLQTEVLKTGELLLRYFISPDKLYVFLVSKDDFKVVPLNVKEKEIKYIIDCYLQALVENNTRNMKKYGNTLYQKLFKPLETSIKESKDVFFIPDGDLARIPFESLIIDKEKPGRPVFLLERYNIKYIQSASLLSILRKHYHRDRETKHFIGFGDPVYDYEKFKQGKPEQGTLTRSLHDRYARAGGIMNRLPQSGEEVETIARFFKEANQKSTVYSREKATEGNAKTPGMKNFDYIHFACHGLLNDDFQSLVLSQLPPDQSPDDGYFTLNEIMNCDYNAKLVVLSACQTGTGKMERAEGVTGLTRAVMYAGTPAVVASLWKVDDTATKELMIRFYRNMLEKNLDKTEALRQAKLDLLKTKSYSSPLFWSAFIMYGE